MVRSGEDSAFTLKDILDARKKFGRPFFWGCPKNCWMSNKILKQNIVKFDELIEDPRFDLEDGNKVLSELPLKAIQQLALRNK